MTTTQQKRRAKFYYKNSNEIQDAINAGEINEFDIVFTSDTREVILIKDDLSLHAMQSKVYSYPSKTDAETALNANTDTYEGQIVSVYVGTAYQGFIVNKDRFGKFFVTSLAQSGTQLDYDTLGNRPITNLTGVLGDPVICTNLSTGIYKIAGTYKISETLATTFYSSSSCLFLIENGGSTIRIKRISPDDMVEYIVSVDGTVTQNKVVTENLLTEKSYLTQTELDTKLESYLLKSELDEYITNNFTQIVDARIDAKIQQATLEEARDVFVDIFQ